MLASDYHVSYQAVAKLGVIPYNHISPDHYGALFHYGMIGNYKSFQFGYSLSLHFSMVAGYDKY
jgi:hypothetical protein